jgi:hypothetical protein
MRARIGQTLIISILVLILYFDQDDTKKGISNKNGGFYFIAIFQVMTSMMSSLLTF